jgi:hypothetical protein
MWAPLVLLSARAAAAEGGEECMSAAESAQTHRRAGKLLQARSELLACAKTSCPRVVRDDCTRWLAQVDEVVPTVVLQARANGRDVTDVRVLVDGQLVATQLDGRETMIDPGPHVLRFERDGKLAEERVVIAESQKARLLGVTFSEQAAPESQKTRPVPAATWIFGAIGVVGLGASAYFFGEAISFNAKLNDLHCAPRCDPDDGDTLRRLTALGWISLGVGAASLVTATIFYLTRPERAAPTVGLQAGPGWIGASGTF